MTNEKSNSGRRDSFQHHSAQSDRVQSPAPGPQASILSVLSAQAPDVIPYSQWPQQGLPSLGLLVSPWWLTFPVCIWWELCMAHHSSIGAGFSNEPLQALSTLHPLTDYSPGWPPTMEERAARRRCVETTPTSSPPAPWWSSWGSVYHLALFCILQSRKAFVKGLVCTQVTHPPPSKTLQQPPAQACLFLSIWKPGSHSVGHSLGPGKQYQKCWPASCQGEHPTPLWEVNQNKTANSCHTRTKKNLNQICHHILR